MSTARPAGIMPGSLRPEPFQARGKDRPDTRFPPAIPSSDPDPQRVAGTAPAAPAGAAASLAKGGTMTLSRCAMSRVCQVTGKRTTTGNNVSHAMNKTRRRFMPNLHERRFWVASENRWVKLRVSTAALRTIDKNGIDAVLADLRKRGEKV